MKKLVTFHFYSFQTLITFCLFFQPFQKVCYTMDERHDMLNSINSFLDETVVLPPGIVNIITVKVAYWNQ